jgi:hypothetical protein
MPYKMNGQKFLKGISDIDDTKLNYTKSNDFVMDIIVRLFFEMYTLQ